MKNKRQIPDEALREFLRRGDPAAGEPGLAPADAQQMRRTVLTALPHSNRGRALSAPGSRRWFWATVAAGCVVLATSVLWLATRSTPQAPAPPAVARAPVALGSGREPLIVREIHFIAPGGTQIIWVLKSGAEL